MSTLALPLGARRKRIAGRSHGAIHPLLASKRLLQLALIALIVVPIPSDDGPYKAHAPAVVQARPAVFMVAKVTR